MVDIVLKDRGGGDVIYPNIETVSFDTKDGGKAIFTVGVAVDGLEIVPNFFEGDMSVIAPDGMLVKSATIKQPETLIPENIAEGVTVAGIIGTKIGADFFITYKDDNEKILYKKPIMYGDTAGNAIALGLMEKPHKENTETDEYDFLGWTDSIGGDVKTSMFENVTEDRTVYAVFKSTALIASGVCGDNAKWRLNVDGVFTVSGSGAMYDYEVAADRPWNSYVNDVTSVIVEDGITHVGKRSFNLFANMTDAQIAESVTTFGTHIFAACSSLVNVNIPAVIDNLPMSTFFQCTALQSIDIPNGVTSIGNYAFNGCTALTSVDIPDGVTSIGNDAFNTCTALTSINIPNGVTSIADNTFSSCTALTSITLGENVQSIGDSAFVNTSKLTSIIIPASVTSIGKTAFWFGSITSVTFKDTTTWYVTQTKGATSGTTLSSSNLANKTTAATYLNKTYLSYYWYKK